MVETSRPCFRCEDIPNRFLVKVQLPALHALLLQGVNHRILRMERRDVQLRFGVRITRLRVGQLHLLGQRCELPHVHRVTETAVDDDARTTMVERIVQRRFYGRLPLSSGLPPQAQATRPSSPKPQPECLCSIYCSLKRQ